jgi:peptidoglycan/LPS O-acetylase OafA/YrhL
MGILRVLLALFVVFDHFRSYSTFDFPGGVFAVKVFFIISGFYMTMILEKKYVGKGSYTLFLSNRFLRLYPIYWVVLGLTIGASFISYFAYNDWLRLTQYVVYHDIMNIKTLVFQGFANIFLFGQDIVMFLGMDPEKGTMYFSNNFNETNPPFHTFLFVPQAWTIGMELLFYIVAPFLVRRKTKIILTIITVSLLLRIFFYYYLGWDHDPWTYRFFPNELALFLLGAMSFRFYQYIKKYDINIRIKFLIIIMYFFILLFYKYIPGTGELIENVKIIGFYLFTSVSIPFIFITTKKSRIDNRVGDLSYPIYIVHMFVIYIVSSLMHNYNLQFNKSIVVIISTIIISYILVKFVSDPVEKIRQNRVKTSNSRG